MRLLYDARLAARGLGISTFVVQLARALTSDSAIELVWFGDAAMAPAGTSSVVDAGRKPYPLLDGPAGRGLARRLGVELVHFTANTGWTRRSPVPSVLTVHDLIFLDTGIGRRSARQVIGHRYERIQVPRAVAAADMLVVPSQTVAAEVRARFSSEPAVVYAGVEQSHAGSATTEPRAGCGEGGATDHPPYIVAFAGRDPRKQTAAVVDAWRQLAESPLRLHLLAAGGMPLHLRESLAPELRTGAVEIHGYLPRAQVESLLAGALALVYPSTDEGFGLPVLEGMAAGVPVISGIAPVTREIGGDAIMQLDPADVVGSTVATLRRLVADPNLAVSARARGRARAGEFTWQAAAAGYLEAYRKAIGRRP